MTPELSPSELDYSSKPDSIESVNSFFRGLRKYNEMFSPSAIVTRLYLERETVGDCSSEYFLNKEGEYPHMQASALLHMYRSTLNEIGLSIEPVAATGMTVMVQGGEVAGTELRVNVVASRKFIPFLRSLDPDEIKKTGLRTNLENLSEILIKQILTHYDLTDPSDEALQLLKGLSMVVEEYDRLGMREAANKLNIYLVQLNDRNLATYVNFERNKHLILDSSFSKPRNT